MSQYTPTRADSPDHAWIWENSLSAAGETRPACLADVIDDSWLDRFTPGSSRQIYPYTPATTRVVLTEAQDEAWRCGWNLDGVYLGGQSGPVDREPGSPFPYRPRGYGS